MSGRKGYGNLIPYLASVLALPAADIWRVGRAVDSATDFVLGVLGTLPSFNNARTCCSLEISARTSVTMLSLLNVFPRVARCDRTG
jgi:hypothetical protein